MSRRVLLISVAALVAAAALAPAAGAQQINPGGPNAQLAQYVEPAGGGGGRNPEQHVVGLGGGGEAGGAGQVGAAGELAFTGLMVLPFAVVGISLLLGGVALKRRRTGAVSAT